MTRWGLAVNVPVEGELCWDAPLPCASPPILVGLRLRREGDLGSGFRVDYLGAAR